MVGQLRELVGNQHLLAQTDEKTVYALSQVRGTHMALRHLMGNGAIPHYRARYQLRKHRDIQQQIMKASLHRRLMPVDIHQVGNRLEGVETDAYRQHDAGGTQIKAQRIKLQHKKIRVLESTQNQDIDSQA